ncbi:MAG: hypothetical protein EA358_03760 [Flavobacteriales bacterium]|nr:MAG: hypothetical protein EA358_03760 [Flavobacteriales bacterium]
MTFISARCARARDCSGKPGGQNASGRQRARATEELLGCCCGHGGFVRGLAAESAIRRPKNTNYQALAIKQIFRSIADSGVFNVELICNCAMKKIFVFNSHV